MGHFLLISLVRLRGVFGAFELNLQTFSAYLEAMHRLNCRGGRIDVIKRHKAKTLGKVRLLINKHFRGDHTAEGQESRGEVRVSELLWQVINKQIATFRSYLNE